MIGIVVVAHGGFAAELLKATEHVIGALPAAKAIGLGPRDDLAQRRTEIENAVNEVDDGAGVVILTDLFGGTPSNLAIAMMASGNVDVITGANLPMMMKLARSRNLDRREAVNATIEAGCKYIIDVAAVLSADPSAATKAS